MKKRFTVILNIPVYVDVIGDDSSGEVDIINVCNVGIPSISDINDALTDDDLRAIDEAFEESDSVV